MIRTSLMLLVATSFATAQGAGVAAKQPAPPMGSLLNSSTKSGGGPCAITCQSANTTCTTPWGAGNTNTFAIILTSGANGDTVRGFDLGTKYTVASSVTCYLHLADAAGQPILPPARTGTMSVGTTFQLYNVTFATPLAVPPATRYFIAFDNGGMEHPICGAGGVPNSYYWHPPAATTWNGIFTQAWVFQVDCGCANAAARAFYGTGCGAGPLGVGNTHTLPSLGQTGQLLMFGGPTAGAGVFLIGAVQTNTSLAGAGMPGCSLYTNPLVSLGTSFSAGNATPVQFDIPNQPFLCGGSLFISGAAVWVGQNPTGVVTANGMQFTFGS